MDIPIGELSRRTGVKVPTIRYYEQVDLLPTPSRTHGHQRRYGTAEITRLNFIRQARDLGFDIGTIRELLALSSQPDQSCAEIDQLARHHMRDVERRISQLEALRAELQRVLSTCGRGRVGECQVLEALSGSSLAGVATPVQRHRQR
jgi:DNA-binding transcriptional MerR regulator